MQNFHYGNEPEFPGSNAQLDYLDDKPLVTFTFIPLIFFGFFFAIFFFIFFSMLNQFPGYGFSPLTLLPFFLVGGFILIFAVAMIIRLIKSQKEYIAFDARRMVLTYTRGKNVQTYHLDESYLVDLDMFYTHSTYNHHPNRTCQILFVLKRGSQLLIKHDIHVKMPSFSLGISLPIDPYENCYASWKHIFESHGIRVNTPSSPTDKAYKETENYSETNSNQEHHSYSSSYSTSYQMKEDADYVRSHFKKTSLIYLAILTLIMIGLALTLYFTTIFNHPLESIPTVQLILSIVIIAINIIVPICFGIYILKKITRYNRMTDSELLQTEMAKRVLAKKK